MRYTNWQKVKRALDGTNAHRKHFTATGHTLSRNVNDPAQVTAVVHFADLHGAREWVEAIMPPEKFATIFGGPGLICLMTPAPVACIASKTTFRPACLIWSRSIRRRTWAS